MIAKHSSLQLKQLSNAKKDYSISPAVPYVINLFTPVIY